MADSNEDQKRFTAPPMTQSVVEGGFFSNLRSDLPASVVVFLVALPLCLGIALASGAPLFSGIIAGIVGGIVVSLISGSPLGVSGPAAGLAVVVLNAIADLGSFETFLLCVVVGGVFQLLLGVFRAGVVAYFFPNVVIKGMLAGIGVVIFLKQLPHAFGYDKNPEGQLGFAQPDGYNTMSELSHMLSSLSLGPIITAALGLFVLILWEQPFIKKRSISQILPGPLIVVLSGVALNLAFRGTSLAFTENQLVRLPVAQSIGEFFQQFKTPDFTQLSNPKIYTVALTLAAVASLETLLCVEATDKLDPARRVTPTNRELVAQGLGNITSGLIGGLPVTQVIVRSSANIQSGGRTKASAFMHGVFLLICAVTIPGALNLFPLSSLAAILLVVGYKLANPRLIAAMYARGWHQLVPFLATVAGIIFTDLLKGIGIGLAIAIMEILWQHFVLPCRVEKKERGGLNVLHVQLSGDLTFLNKASILRTLSELPTRSHVIIDGVQTHRVHPDIVDIIEDFLENARVRMIRVNIEGLTDTGLREKAERYGLLFAQDEPLSEIAPTSQPVSSS